MIFIAKAPSDCAKSEKVLISLEIDQHLSSDMCSISPQN